MRAAWRKRHAAFFRRPGLEPRLRHAAALSALQAIGDWNGFACQAAWALEAGIAQAWLAEALLQSYLFVGFPRAIEALQILHRAGQAAGGPPAGGPGSAREIWREEPPRDGFRRRGEALCARIYGPHYEALLTVMNRTHPDLAAWMVEEGYGKVLARAHPEMDPRARELCVIPQLAALEAWPQLRSHAAGARRMGASPDEVLESLRTGLRMASRCDATRARQETRHALSLLP